MVWVEAAIFSNKQVVGGINLALECWWHGDFERFSVCRGDPTALIGVNGGTALIE
jgi:hypothetical protein